MNLKDTIKNLERAAGQGISPTDIEAYVSYALEKKSEAERQAIREAQAYAQYQGDLYKQSAAAIDNIVNLTVVGTLAAKGQIGDGNFQKVSSALVGEADRKFTPEDINNVLDIVKHELAVKLSEGMMSQDVLEQQLLEAAAEDPEVAAELISEDMGEDVSPEEVDALAEQIESVLADEEMDEEEQEEKLSNGLQHLPEFTQYIIGARAAHRMSVGR